MVTMTSTNSEKRNSPRHRNLRSVAKLSRSSPRIANSATMGANASIGSVQPLKCEGTHPENHPPQPPVLCEELFGKGEKYDIA